jgi:hypothetical protein
MKRLKLEVHDVSKTLNGPLSPTKQKVRTYWSTMYHILTPRLFCRVTFLRSSPDRSLPLTMIGFLKIYHRSNFWGQEVQGRHSERRRGIHERVLHTQVVMENYHQFFGCCFSHGPRVSELKEHHFLTQYKGFWNLFLMERKISASTGAYHMNFALLPDYVVANPMWKHEGVINPHTTRMELGRHFHPILATNKPYGYPRNHVHLMIVMDAATCPHVNGWDSCPCPSLERKVERLVSAGLKVTNQDEDDTPDMVDENEPQLSAGD